MMARLATGAMPAWTIAATLAGLPLHLGMILRRKRGLAWLGTALLTRVRLSRRRASAAGLE